MHLLHAGNDTVPISMWRGGAMNSTEYRVSSSTVNVSFTMRRSNGSSTYLRTLNSTPLMKVWRARARYRSHQRLSFFAAYNRTAGRLQGTWINETHCSRSTVELCRVLEQLEYEISSSFNFECMNTHLLHFAWVVDDAKCIVVTRVCVRLSVCPRPHAHIIARTRM